ncbi:hypothetical protein [Candidatus Kuenenia sp.]|uniref:hypothetical protein n=1 Tax=Candidatus Kuenenia sp. TaxID=2499824 RepID=UPI00321F77E7
MLKDMIDALKLVTEGIDSVKTIAEAVKSGKDYIEAKHPEVRSDLRLMVDELQKSLLLIKRASAVLTNFRFAISADVQGSELVRFNDYFIQSKTEAQHLENHIDDLRTHCSKIRKHGTKIGGEATVAGFTKVFTLLGLNSPQREQKLGQQLDKLAYEDYAVANSAAKMLECLVSALKDVQNALGDGGTMHPENVATAAALLAEYGPEFERTEEQAAQAVKDIRELVKELE